MKYEYITKKYLDDRIEVDGDHWIWTGTYIAGWPRAGDMRASRAVWSVFIGEVPFTIHVVRVCDNKKCVNPSHHTLLSHSEASRRTWNLIPYCVKSKGKQSPAAKLTWTTVQAIRDSSLSCSQAAKVFGVSRQSIHSIRTYKTWKVNHACE